MRVAQVVGRRVGAALVAAVFLLYGVAPAAGTALQPAEPDPYIGPEQPVSGRLPSTPQPGDDAAVAASGNSDTINRFLVVWDGGLAATYDISTGAIGHVIRLPGTELGADNPDVQATTFESFFVVWESTEPGVGIAGIHVSTDGRVLDPAPLVLTDDPAATAPKISFHAGGFVVVWRTAEGIGGTVVSEAGTVLEPARLLVSTHATGDLDIYLDPFHDHHLVVWEHESDSGGDIYGALLNEDGSALNPTGFPIETAPGDQSHPSVIEGGEGFMVVWDDQRSGDHDIYGARLDYAGAIRDPAGFPIATGPGAASDPVFGESFFGGVVVAWQGDTGAVAARVDWSGTVLDPGGFALSTLETVTDIALTSSSALVVGKTGDAIGGVRLGPLGREPSDAFPISVATFAQTDPVSAFDGTNTLVVWRDERVGFSDGPGLYGGRLGPAGEMLDNFGFPIATAETETNAPIEPSAAYDGANFFLAVWADDHGDAIKGAALTRFGGVILRLTISVAAENETVGSPVVAFGNDTFLIGWESSQTPPSGDDLHTIRAARVQNWNLIDPSGFEVAQNQPTDFDIAAGDTDFLVVSQQGSDTAGDIYGTRVTTSGTVPMPDGVPIATGDASQIDPRVAWNGDRYLVVWGTAGDADTQEGYEIRAARLDGDGTVLDPAGIPIATEHGVRGTPDVAANGPFLVTWYDRRRDLDALFATRVDPDGTVGDPDGFEVFAADGFTGPVAAVRAAGDGVFSVTYTRTDVYDTSQVFFRHVWPK